MNEESNEPVFETAIELYREIRSRGLHLRHGDGRDDVLIDELCNSIGCPDEQLAEFLKQEDRSAEWFMGEFLQLAAPFARMFSEVWEYLASEEGPKATEDIRIRFGFEEDDITEVDLTEFRERARTARNLWVATTRARWPDKAIRELFGFADCVDVEGVIEGSGYYPREPYQLPTIDTHHEDDFEEIVRRVRNLFQNIIDGAAKVHQEEYNNDFLGSKSEPEQSTSSVYWAADRLHDLLGDWEQIFRYHHQVSVEDRRKAVDFYRENIAPMLREEEVLEVQDLQRPLDILRLPFWKHRWHTYEVWATVQTLEVLSICNPDIRVVDGRIPIDGQSTEIVADLDVIGNPDACVVTQLETPFQGEDKTSIKPDLSICRTQDFDAKSRAVVIEYKQRLSLARSHVNEVSQQYLTGSPEAVGLVMVNYDTVPDMRLPEAAELLGDVRPGSATVAEFHDIVQDFMEEADLLGKLEQKAVLVDVSGSMGNDYSNPEVKDALQKLLEWTEEGLRLYRFNDGLTENPQISAKEVESGLQTGGGTDVTRAIQDVCRHFAAPRKLLLVTDGQDRLPPSNPEGIEDLRECTPQDLPSEIGWLRGAD